MAPRPEPVRLLAAAAALALIALATLPPLPGQAPQSAATPFLCLFCGDGGAADFILNVALFVPFGLALGRLGVGLRTGVAAVALLTLTIEGLQLTILAGRDSALGDLVANLAGGAAGLLLVRHWRRLLAPDGPAATVLRAAAMAVPVAVSLATVVLLRPDLPGGPWYGQWAPAEAGERWFEGRLLEAEAGGVPLPRWRLSDPEAMRARLAAGPVSLAARVVTGPPTGHHARIVSLSGDRARLLELGQAGAAFRFSFRTRGQPLLLRRPVAALRGALPAAGVPVRVEGAWSRGRVTLRAAPEGGPVLERTQPLSVGQGWAFFLPLPLDGGFRAMLLEVLWIAALFVPLGRYGAAAGAGSARGGRAPGAALGVMAVALVLAPFAAGGPAASAAAWLGAFLGFGAGAAGAAGAASAARTRVSAGPAPDGSGRTGAPPG